MKRTKSVLTHSLFLIAYAGLSHAAAPVPAPTAKTLPTGGQVVAGSATISSSSTANTAVMNINQTSQRAVVNWDSFNVGKNATVNFNQPNSSAVTLNRVTGGNASVINGAIHANGQVVLVNENGVVFGKGAQVNAAAVTASTLNIADQEFMDGKSTYKDDGTGVGSNAGKIINKGKIQTNNDNGEGGFIALLAPEVRNQGYLLAQKGGTVAIGSGSQITLHIQGQTLVAIKVDESVYNGLITNKRIIEAPGGLVVLATGAANQLMAGVIKNTGRISANSLESNGGVIELVAKSITQAGQVSANSQTKEGGQVNLVASEITLTKNSKTTATGAAGGGQVNIGLANTQVSGGSQVNSQSNTQTTTANAAIIKTNANQAAQTNQLANTVAVQESATIDTSATQAGNGGSIAIWSKVQTTVAGILKSMGGAILGNGGFIETSSQGQVVLAPTASINTSANNPTGKAGTWLLDPIDLIINSDAANVIANALANTNVTIAVTNSTTACPIGSCTQTNVSGANSSLTIASGADILKLGTNYTTLTLSSEGIFNLNANIGGQNLDVIISSSIAYLNVGSSINASKVTVQAQTIYSAGSIQTSNYLLGANPGSLGNAIALLAQAIYVSGRLSANAIGKVAGSITLTADTIRLYPNAVLEANGDEGGLITIAANDSLWSSATVQANGGNGRGGTLLLTAANDQYFDQSALQANGTTDGGAITITTQSGDIYFANSMIQTNGSTGRGGSIGLSATNVTQIANSNISANGYSQGGTILIGNDATNGSLPFSMVTTIDEKTTVNAAQLDPNPTNQHGGFIETSGHTLNLLATINAGRGGMWLLDPNDISIEALPVLGGTPFAYVSGSSYTYTAGASSVVYTALITSALATADVIITTTSGNITVNGAISGVRSLTLLASSGNIQLNAGIQLTGAGSSIVLKASGYISTAGANTYLTNGGDVIFWSNTGNVTSTAATNANFIYLDSGTKLMTVGGAIYLAGGLPSMGTTSNGNNYPTGYAFTGSVNSGVLLGSYAGNGIPIIIKSDGGNIVIAGQTTNTNLPGFSSQSSLLIDSGMGTISLTGTAHNGHGIELGYGSAYSNIVITSASSSPTAIQINGMTDGGSVYKGFWAIHLAGSATPGVLIQATGFGGGVSLTGINTPSGIGVYLSDIAILANNGPIQINSTALVTQSTSSFLGACSGTAHPCASFTIGDNTYTPITNSSSNIAINVDARNAGGVSWNGVLSVDTTGGLTIAPYTADGWAATPFTWSGSNALSGGITTFTADANSFIGIADKLMIKKITSLTIGASDSTNTVNINQDTGPFGNLSVHAGNININAPIHWVSGEAINLISSGNISVNADLVGPSSGLTAVYGGTYSCSVCSSYYVLLNPGSSVYGSVPNLTYGIYTSAAGTTLASSAISSLVSGTASWSGVMPDSTSSVGSYPLSYSSGLSISSLSYSLIAGNPNNWTITPAPLGIKVTATYTSGSVFTPSNSVIAATGLMAGQTITSLQANSSNVGPGNFVTTSGLIGAGGFLASNYAMYAGSEVGNSGVLAGGIYSGTVSGATNSGGTNTVNINRANLAITANPSPSGNVYNGNAYNGTYVTNALGSDQGLMTISGIATGVNAGTYTSNLAVNGAVLSNYNTPVITNANLVISPKPITITDIASHTNYDAATNYATLMANAGYTLSSALVGSDTIGAINQTASSVGSTSLSGIAQAGIFFSTPSAAVLSIGNANNYLFSYATASNTVAKASLTIAAIPNLTGNVYNGSTYNGTYVTNALGSDQGLMTISGIASGVDAGIYTSNLAVSGSVLSNYNSPVIRNANLVITPAPLVIKANDLARVAGTAFYGGNGVTYTGLLNGESPSVLSGVLTYSGSAQGASNAGAYVIQPGGLTSQNYSIGFISSVLVNTPQPVVNAITPPPPPPPPPMVFSIAPPPPPPAAAAMVSIAPPPPAAEAGSGGREVAPPPVAAAMVAAPDGGIALAPAPAAPPPTASAPPPAAPSGANPSNTPSSSTNMDASSNKPSEGKPNGTNSKGERIGKYDARRLAESKEAKEGKGGSDKPGSKKAEPGVNGETPPKYAGKYANGFRAAEKAAGKDGANKSLASNKANPPREGKYSNRVNALNNGSASASAAMVAAAMSQHQFSSTGLPPLPGAPAEAATPTILRGGDSLTQSYDDVPSIRNSGVANAGRSRNTENYHESLESVNLMSTLNLFIVH
ncbi:filamentous hemagglutinin N-terminal domain-containing protein [Polynucleobacter asymbioticus]|uniref:two-partner secretion domain-containing protein n=1 Tax=Polynucleobacter asymbioticus TaxID=576611 RepID=UPI001372BA9A|nr:filamentous hemagglutinin N-terminal domain-containing protein [Polynucleobacter asymbioticus]